MGRRLLYAGAAGLLVASAGAYEAYQISQDPTTLLTPVRSEDLPPEIPIQVNLATFVCASDVAIKSCDELSMLGSTSAGKHKDVYLDAISPYVPQAIEASEDRNYRDHHGVDGKAIIRAAVNNGIASLENLEIIMPEGASSITQQDARWRYGLDHADSLSEKQYEGELAMGLEIALEEPCRELLGLPATTVEATSDTDETTHTYAPDVYKLIRACVKDQVMADYLNRVYFGRGAYGIEMAAEQWFGTTAKDLTQARSLFITSALKSPSNTDLVAGTPEALKVEEEKHKDRYEVIVNDLYENNDITDEERDSLIASYEQTAAEVVPFVPLGGINTIPAKEIGAEHVTVRAMSEAAAILGISQEDLASRGYKVVITIDRHAQEVAANLVRLNNANTAGYQAAITAVAKNGAVITMVGGLDRTASKVNLATGVQGGGSGRNAGSSNKDIVLALALENGHTPDDVIHINADAQGHGTYTMVGADNGKDYVIDTGDGCKSVTGAPPPCDMTIRQASEVSSNVGYAQLLGESGSAPQYGSVRVYDIMRDFGSDIQGDPVASVVVGSGDVSTYTQAVVRSGLYLNQGQAVEPYLVEKIMDASGKLVYDHSALVIEPGEQVVAPQVAIDVLQTMRAPVEGQHGTAHVIETQFGTPANTVSGKTGTAPKTTDVWWNGAASDNETGGIALSVWIGNPDKPTTLPDGVTSKNAAAIAGAYFTGIGAAIDGSQLPTAVS